MEALSKALFCHALVAGASPTAHRGQRRAGAPPFVPTGGVLVVDTGGDLVVFLVLFRGYIKASPSLLHGRELMVPAFALVKGYCSRVAMLASILLIITWRLGR